jgi:hypothetical protein
MADDATVTTSTSMRAPSKPSQTPTIDELVQQIGQLCSTTRLHGQDAEAATRRIQEATRQIGDVHHRMQADQLNLRAREIAKRPAADMLNELASRGFAWRDIARLLKVSVPAVRRWRQGESLTGPRLLAAARLVALVETMRVDHLVSDVASWMEMPLKPDVPVTGIDLAVDGRYEELLDLAAEHVTPEEILDSWQPGWRSRYRSDFEVFEAPDGDLGIRLTREGDG